MAEQLSLADDAWSVSFQSKFRPGRWLQPYTNQLLRSLPGRGVTSVSVVRPGFAVDSLETCHEIDVEDRALYMAAGGKRFEYVPALNARQSHARALADIIARHCAGWTCFDLAGFSACRERASAQ